MEKRIRSQYMTAGCEKSMDSFEIYDLLAEDLYYSRMLQKQKRRKKLQRKLKESRDQADRIYDPHHTGSLAG